MPQEIIGAAVQFVRPRLRNDLDDTAVVCILGGRHAGLDGEFLGGVGRGRGQEPQKALLDVERAIDHDIRSCIAAESAAAVDVRPVGARAGHQRREVVDVASVQRQAHHAF